MAKWILDAGHGGNDPGAVLFNRKESNDVLKLTKRVAEILKANNEDVVLTRDNDKAVTLQQRTQLENNSKANYFVSIHRNAVARNKADGVETYSISTTGVSRTLAENVQAELKKIFRDRKCKTSNFYVLKNTKAPAILVEVGFIDSDTDNKKFDENFEEIAKSIAVGCLKMVNKTLKAEQKGVYRVIVGSYSDKANATGVQEQLKNKGFASFLEFKEV